MLSEDQIKKYDQDGFLVLKNFLNLEACAELIQEINRIIDTNGYTEDIKKIPIFATNENPSSRNTEQIEKDALNKSDINKIGHALHASNPVFRKVTFSDNVKEIFKSLNYKKPIISQSMCVFKQPFISEEVVPHQDSSYMLVEPNKITGIWIALEDNTLENGCLSFIPGSHKNVPLMTKMIRNPNENEFKEGKCFIYTNRHPRDIKFDENLFIPVPIKAGDAVIIHGLVVHSTGKNLTPNLIHMYSFHGYESENAKYLEENWLPYSEKTFLPLYETK